MKVLFAVSNEEISEAIVKRYQKQYKEIISYKNVYYFNAILKEIQKDKTYDRIVISEELEAFTNTQYEQIDRFIFDKLDSISDEAANTRGDNTPIILICSDRRTKGEEMLVKLFGIGIYDALIGNDRGVEEVCNLIYKPRSKKEAKLYYKIEADEVKYQAENENDVSEQEIQNILAHYKKLGKNEDRYVTSFDNIVAQYNDAQLRIISKFLPLNVRAVLEEKSPKYQQVMSFNNAVTDSIRKPKNPKQASLGPSGKLLRPKNKAVIPTEPIVIPNAVNTENVKKLTRNHSKNIDNGIQDMNDEVNNLNDFSNNDFENNQNQMNYDPFAQNNTQFDSFQNYNNVSQNNFNTFDNNIQVQQPSNDFDNMFENETETPKRRGRKPRNMDLEQEIETPAPKKRGRPRKNPVIEPKNDGILPGFEQNINYQNEEEDEPVLPGFDNFNGDNILPGFEQDNNTQEETTLPGFEQDNEQQNDSFNNTNQQQYDPFNNVNQQQYDPFSNANQQQYNPFNNANQQQNDSFNNNNNEQEFNDYGFNNPFENQTNSNYEIEETKTNNNVNEISNFDLQEDQNNSFDNNFDNNHENAVQFDNNNLYGDNQFSNNPFIDNNNQMNNNSFEDNQYEDSNSKHVDNNPFGNSQYDNNQFGNYNNTGYNSQMSGYDMQSGDLSRLLTDNKKIATFVGTSKNGTSFIVNNLAEYASSMGINVAILDTTKNKNSYYIYTKNEEELRQVAGKCLENLASGQAKGISVNRNLTVYTSLPEDREELNNVNQILETLVRVHDLILIDCDYDTPYGYFANSQEIYLVQSYDILTIQPLTAFLRELKAQNILDQGKLKILLNKHVKVRGISEKTIVGGMSKYNDPAMSFMTDLFDVNVVKYMTIQFEQDIYTRYLESVINCDVSIKGYSKTFMQTLRELCNWVYQSSMGNNSYRPQTSSYNNTTFSANMNDTLNQMRRKY